MSPGSERAFEEALTVWRAALRNHVLAPSDAGFSARLASLAAAARQSAEACEVAYGDESPGRGPRVYCLPGPADACGTIASVPTICRFHGIVIAMYFDDHGHPHFHARHGGDEAKVRIDAIQVIESNLDVRSLRLVLAWAELHRGELLENWRRARAGETLQDIEPLR